MGKHSSSSSSSSSSDEGSKSLTKHQKKERKKWKKKQKKGLIPAGAIPPWQQEGGYGLDCTAPPPMPHGGGYGDGHGLHCTAPPPMHNYGGPGPQGGAYGGPGPQGGTYGGPGESYGLHCTAPPPMPNYGGPAPQGGGYGEHYGLDCTAPPPLPNYGGGAPPPIGGEFGHSIGLDCTGPPNMPPYGGPGLDCSGPPPSRPPGSEPSIKPHVPPPQPAQTEGVQGIGGQLQHVQLDGCAELFRPTVRHAANFSAEADCQILRQSMKGVGTDEHAIVDIIGHRSNAQRQEIAKYYKTMFGRDIIDDLKSELSGDFRESIMALFKAPAYYDAYTLHSAMAGAGTKESVLIEILCTRTNQQIRDLVACYKDHFKRDLEKDITGDTSGHLKKLLISCSQGNRQELSAQQLQQIRDHGPETVVDRALAQEDARKLQQAGVKRWGTDESAFITVLALRNMYQLQATFDEYHKLTGKDLLDDIGSETSGRFESALKAIVRSSKNRPEYFADKLHNCLKGLGTDDHRLIRLVVSRSEIDLQDIKEVYLQKFNKPLHDAVASDCSGDYKRLLLAIIGH